MRPSKATPWSALPPALLAATLWLGLPARAETAGPWGARVVDANTGESLAGVAVIGVWHRRGAGHPAFPIGPTGVVGVAETETDAAGRFAFPSRLFFNPGIGTQVDGPDLGLFLPGYGGWRFRDGKAGLTRPGVVIEMRPLRSPEERRRYLERGWTRAEHDRLAIDWQHADAPANWIDVPYRQAARYEAAINRERAALGLRPMGIGYPGLGAKYLAPAPPRAGPEAARLRGAGAVAIDAAGLRYVADTEHHRIVVFDAAGIMVAAWGRFGREDGEFQYPRGIALDRAGTVYVADWGNHRIQVFTRDGRFRGKFGGLRFEDFHGLFSPTFVGAPDTGEIVVHADHDDHVLVFTPEGRRRGARRFPLRAAGRSEIAVDATGHLYVVGDQDQRVHKLDREGRVVTSFGRGRGADEGQLFDPAGLAVDAAGRVYVADRSGGRGRVEGFAADGGLLGSWSVGDDGQPLRSPAGLAVDGQGRIHVADSDRPALVTITPAAGP
jgi:sugar lactone lactonase YvrE